MSRRGALAHRATTRTTTPATTGPATRARRSRAVAALAAVGALALTGCTALEERSPSGAGSTADDDATGGTVVLVTHDSFALSEELVDRFEADTGLQLEQRAPGDGGALVNQLVLTKDAPLGDVVYGIDTSFATRAVQEGVLEPYTSPAADADVQARYAVGDEGHLTAVDVGDVCVNVDREWFAENDVPEPESLEDLVDPAYRDLLVVTNPATSSPGLAFLLATVGRFGEDGWVDYWQQLRDNGVKVAGGWSDAYYVDFSGPSSEGDRPLVLSYASSPPYEVPEGVTDAADAPTRALLDTCFRQVEYAGVLAGAANPEGARQVVDWLLSPEVQADIPEQMYVYPVDPDVSLPESWSRFAPQPDEPITLDPEAVSTNREEWIRTWTDTVLG